MSSTESLTFQPTPWACMHCNKPYEDLYILPCDHRFCESCLFAWLRTYTIAYQTLTAAFPCNLCWRVINIPQGGVHVYKRNYQMEQLECTLQGLQMAEPPTSNNTMPISLSHPEGLEIEKTDTMDSGICMDESPQFSIYPAPRSSDEGTFRMSNAQAMDPLNSSQPFCHNHRGNICVAFRTTAGHLL